MVRPAGPSAGAGTGDDGDRELVLALAGETEGLTHREIAAQIWGAERVAEEWWADSWMRSRIKRRRRRAQLMLKQYRDMAKGT